MNGIVPFLNPTGQGVDEPLSETGFKQAAAAGIFLNNVKFTHVFSSDLMRTKQVSLESRFRVMSQKFHQCNLEKSATRIYRELNHIQTTPNIPLSSTELFPPIVLYFILVNFKLE